MPTESVAKRTNSLDDCWSCQKLSQDGRRTKRCDRQRPRCNVCTEAGKVCSGYRQEIQWQGGASRANWKINSLDVTRSSPERGSSTEPSSKRPHNISGPPRPKYEFVREMVEADYVDTSFGHTPTKLEMKRPRTSPENTSLSRSHERDRYLRHEDNPTSDIGAGRRSAGSLPANLFSSLPSMKLNEPPYRPEWQHSRHPIPAFVNPYTQVHHTQTHSHLLYTSSSGSRPADIHAANYIPTYTSLQSSRDTRSRIGLATSKPFQGQRNDPELRPINVIAQSSTETTTSQATSLRSQQPQQPSPPQAQVETTNRIGSEPVRARQSWHEIVGSSAPSNIQTRLSLSRDSDDPTYDDRLNSSRMSSDGMHEDSISGFLPRPSHVADDTRGRRLSSASVQSDQALNRHVLRRLQYFDLVICPIPVTLDKKTMINPYREVLQHISKIPALKEAVLALATRHAESSSLNLDEEEERQSTLSTTESYSIAHSKHILQDGEIDKQADGVLITLLIHILCDTFHGGRADWRAHSTMVASLLEERGGVNSLLSASTVLRAQTATLVWYDMTAALLSRKGCCIPYKYVEALAGCQDSQWSFYGLVGCPEQLCLYLYKICDLAAQSTADDAARTTRIENIEQELWSYTPDKPEDDPRLSIPTAADTARMDELHEQLHASHAWRYALLLYAVRILRGRPSTDPRVLSLARRVIDHARLVSSDKAGASKQLLLPLLLAGAEAAVGSFHRATCIDHFATWHNRTGFKRWLDAERVLHSLWQRQTEDGDVSLVQHLAGREWMFG